MNLFGQHYTGFYINNNGNITFESGMSTFTPFGITGTSVGQPMIAPFFADVDTRSTTRNTSPGGTSTGTNQVYLDMDTTNGVITITWDDVGYYSDGTKVNAFQLRIFDQGNGDFSFEFRYENVDLDDRRSKWRLRWFGWYGGPCRLDGRRWREFLRTAAIG